MPRCWVIAPFEAENRETFDKVWQFDLANGLISIGWGEVGDVSKMSREELSSAIASTYPDKPPATKALYRNMLWAFYHEISPGDFVIARRGLKVLAAVGTVIRSAVYAPGKNPTIHHPNFLEVAWQEQPRDKAFPGLVFRMQTLTEILEPQYRSLLEGSGVPPVVAEPAEAIDQNAFVLEKYLEDFIVSNFHTIFKGKLHIYKDAEVDGQQYATEVGPIDILAVESASGSFVVIELKKGRPSDQVVGQILRYMGWVKKNLCKDEQGVKGLVICRDRDDKLRYAIDMTNNIDVQYYRVSFTLNQAP
jgi:restriction system protein